MATAVGLWVAVFVAAWWLIGDLSYDGPVEGGLDHMYRAPQVPGWLTAGAGAVGLLLAFGAAVRLARPRATRMPALVVIASGVVAAVMARVVTAGVIGANIGGGISVLFGLPLLILVTVSALVAIGVRVAGQAGKGFACRHRGRARLPAHDR